jgi:hypothetical protein
MNRKTEQEEAIGVNIGLVIFIILAACGACGFFGPV